MARLSESAPTRPVLQFGKTALPKGAFVEVILKNGQIFTGQTAVYDMDLDWFVLMEDKGSHYDKIMINYDYVDQVRGMGSVSGSKELPALESDVELMQKAETRLRQSMAEKSYFCGDRASQRAVQTFMELKRILDLVVWDNREIRVMDSVSISEPFGVDQCVALNDSRSADDCLNRVRKILAQMNESSKEKSAEES